MNGPTTTPTATATRTFDAARPQRSPVRSVSRPRDVPAHEADDGATGVTRGADVTGWSFSKVPLAAPIPPARTSSAEGPTQANLTDAGPSPASAQVATPPTRGAINHRVESGDSHLQRFSADPPIGIVEAHEHGNESHAIDLIRKQTGSGIGLPNALGRPLGEHLRHDIAAVRIHTDAFAERTATGLQANAFTVGSDIYFAPGMFAPDEPDGLLRLAHELVHTVQQRGSGPTSTPLRRQLEAEAEAAVTTGSMGSITTAGPMILSEPTFPRRTTGDAMIREAERILTTTRNPFALDATTRLWSLVPSNFTGSTTAGTIARRIWSFIFLRHFTEPESRPGVESQHPRYFYSGTYGWIDGQHFFGFIDFAEQQLQNNAGNRETAFQAATRQGIDIEADQQSVREKVILGAPPATGPERLLQVRPPNTALFRTPQMVAGAAAQLAATAYASIALDGTQAELFALLDQQQTQKFWLDSAKSAWSYEDIASNQLGIRFFFEHGARINAMAPAAREPAFLAALSGFFSGMGVENNQARLDELAQSLPGQERYDRPTTTEARERQRHPELFRAPPP
jgi:hypothetical protein